MKMIMSKELLDWEKSGSYLSFGPNGHQIFIKEIGDSKAVSQKTLLLFHGFPESSYSYHLVIEGLLELFDRIILFDFVGYGWSDKPTELFSYSLMEQAEVAFAVWKYFGITGGHLLAHDMGNSVATEILSRNENQLMPGWFSKGLQSLTFTNGSLILSLSKLRITQKILLTRFGKLFKNVLSFKLFEQQIKSAHGNGNLSDQEIKALWDANLLQEGHEKTHLTIQYINDRKKFEKTRWLPALAHTKLPIHLCWGDQDQVARVEMAHQLKNEFCTDAKLTIMNGLGHFGQLGSPDKWVDYVGEFYKKI